MIRVLTSSNSAISISQSSRAYSRGVRNILRNRYPFRNADGTYKEYNESITIVPKEFEKQDEYKKEKLIAEEYERRYKEHLQAKEKMFSIRLPEEKNESKVEDLCDFSTNENASDQPVKLHDDPYKKKMHQCIFCKYKIPLDYKNTQLLSQFISPHTGIIYSQQVTGLCHYKYVELENTIFRARKLGLLPFFYKETFFTSDPKLFDPFKNNLKNIPNNYDKRKLNSDE